MFRLVVYRVVTPLDRSRTNRSDVFAVSDGFESRLAVLVNTTNCPLPERFGLLETELAIGSCGPLNGASSAKALAAPPIENVSIATRDPSRLKDARQSPQKKLRSSLVWR